MTDLQPDSPVLKFYDGARVFLTGVTGFFGKVFLEKFLRDFPNLDHLYLLIRTKKNKDPGSRLKELFADPLFDKLKKERPEYEKKITCIPGDVGYVKFNLTDEEYEFLTGEITHVIHSAATVRFDEKLKLAFNVNVLGTAEIVEFCKKCPKLKILAHLSTAYTHCYRKEVDEEFYDPPIEPQHAFEFIKYFSEEKLDGITPELIKPWPNTYTFTKAIAETLIKERADFPYVIIRPGIVCGTESSPVPGWTDNVNGAMSVVVGVGLGVLRVLVCNADNTANLVPVDYTINTVISASWFVGSRYTNNEPERPREISEKLEVVPRIYNVVPAEENSLTWGRFQNITCKLGESTPSNQALWLPYVKLTKSQIYYYFLVLFLHYVPAIIIDVVFILGRKKPVLWKAYGKINKMNKEYRHFTMDVGKFKYGNSRKLWRSLTEADRKLFKFDMVTLNWEDYFSRLLPGLLLYIMKESPEILPQAKRRYKMFWIANKIIIIVFFGFWFWMLSKIFFSLASLRN